mmetsp:Transcript_24448/g.34270  ORF Transcript_24448/g.34270 Transcript_24448/m.34270 type:complete len:334 (+) Transcript_24448:57-1058(+)|eukprot:CAMPEP_0168551806 /NCGR_PEP_ID=MMETSP0413-20121227/6376_1 /TAXON_ID=136452 /ORGANISM="Filamoeba nolandi, Strain NC-AS-23-1" /LENGTH=333 /DNA_ID=CAMNT_0008582371 /DNA_START=48 /DNA_END=1049 /DNA_ORIENTATION=+
MDEHVIASRKSDKEYIQKLENPPKQINSAVDLFRYTHVAELLPGSHDQKIILVNKDDPATDAFKKISEHKILSVPVYDPSKQVFIGFIDVLDMVHYVIETAEAADLRTFSQLLTSSQQLEKESCGEIVDVSGRNPYYPIDENAYLSVAVKMLVDQKAHRLPVVDSRGNLITILTQSHVVRLIWNHMHKFSVYNKSLAELHLAFKDVYTIGKSKKVIEAFQVIRSKGVSGIAVVNKHGKLIGNISASDLKQIGSNSDLLHHLFVSTKDYLKYFLGVDRIPKPYCVQPSATLEEALGLIIKTRAHRIYVVDEERHPIGVISLTDILKVVLQSLKL